MMLRTYVMVLLFVVAGAVAAFEPREGTEVLLVDPDGQSILGFGRIRNGGLDLQLSPATGEFTLMLVQEDGSVEVFGGRREGIERLEILVPDVGVRTLASLLSEAGFAFDVTMLERLGQESASDGLPTPDEPSPAPAPDDDGADDDGADDDADDDEGDDGTGDGAGEDGDADDGVDGRGDDDDEENGGERDDGDDD